MYVCMYVCGEELNLSRRRCVLVCVSCFELFTLCALNSIVQDDTSQKRLLSGKTLKEKMGKQLAIVFCSEAQFIVTIFY